MPDAVSVAKGVINFLARLADESERAAVVMGVALVDESLGDAGESGQQYRVGPAQAIYSTA